jgi:hypothetical protein
LRRLSTREFAACLLLVALALSPLVFVQGESWYLNHDGAQYIERARNLLDHGRFAEVDGSFPAVHGPGMAFLVALVWLLLPDDPAAAVWLVRIAGVVCVVLLYLLGRRLAGPPAGFVAAGLFALMPAATSDLYRKITPDLVMLAFLLGGRLLLFSALDRRSRARGLLAGCLFALAVLMKETAFLVAAPLLLLPVVYPPWRGAERVVFSALLPAVAALLAWFCLRQEASDYDLLSGAPVGLVSLLSATCVAALAWLAFAPSLPAPRPGAAFVAAALLLYGAGLAYVDLEISTTVGEFTPEASLRRLQNLFADAPLWPLLVAAPFACVTLSRRYPAARVPAVLAGGFLITGWWFLQSGESRHALPLAAMLCLSAGVAAAPLAEMVPRTGWSQGWRPAAAAVAAVGLVFLAGLPEQLDEYRLAADRQEPRRAIASWLQGNASSDKRVVVVGDLARHARALAGAPADVSVVSPAKITGALPEQLAEGYLAIELMAPSVDCADTCIAGVTQLELLVSIAESEAAFVLVQAGDGVQRYLERAPGFRPAFVTSEFTVYRVSLDRLRPIRYRPVYSGPALEYAAGLTGMDAQALRQASEWTPR